MRSWLFSWMGVWAVAGRFPAKVAAKSAGHHHNLFFMSRAVIICLFFSEALLCIKRRRQAVPVVPALVHSFFFGRAVMPEQVVCIPVWSPRRQLSAKVRKEGGYGRSDVAIFYGSPASGYRRRGGERGLTGGRKKAQACRIMGLWGMTFCRKAVILPVAVWRHGLHKAAFLSAFCFKKKKVLL